MQLSTAKGAKLQIARKCVLNFEIEHISFSFEFVVADIEEKIGILGIDFFKNYNACLQIHKRVLLNKIRKSKNS
jgi:hypothetical protein